MLATLPVAWVLAPAAGAADVVIKDPHGIACPQSPAGWYNPPGDGTATTSGGRTIIAPGTIVNVGEGPQGGNTVNVTCDYFTNAGKHMLVELLYALPTDPNPINDFYFGCQTGGTTWTNAERTFRLMSGSQWAAVAFVDYLSQLGGSDVPAFETVARQLLQNSNGYAHGCTLKVEPAPTLSRRQFSFAVEAGSGQGLFFTEGVAAADRLEPVIAVGIDSITLHVKSGGKRRLLQINVTRGLDFLPSKATARGLSSKAQVRLSIVVKNSSVPGCRAGSTGTLIVASTPSPSVLLKVCSRSFLQGPAKATIIGL